MTTSSHSSTSESIGRRGGVGGTRGASGSPQETATDDAFVVQLITVEEAARRLSIARSHVYRYLERGELPSLLIGRCRRVAVQDLEEFVRRRRVAAGIV